MNLLSYKLSLKFDVTKKKKKKKMIVLIQKDSKVLKVSK